MQSRENCMYYILKWWNKKKLLSVKTKWGKRRQKVKEWVIHQHSTTKHKTCCKFQTCSYYGEGLCHKMNFAAVMYGKLWQYNKIKHSIKRWIQNCLSQMEMARAEAKTIQSINQFRLNQVFGVSAHPSSCQASQERNQTSQVGRIRGRCGGISSAHLCFITSTKRSVDLFTVWNTKSLFAMARGPKKR